MITNQYTYNGDGQRVQIVDSQGTKKQIWDFENILLETDGSDVTQVVYTLEPAGYGNLVSQRRGSTTSYYLYDALGSTRKLTDSSGGVTDSYDYRAYGETFASSGSTTNVFRWVGELGYYYDIDRLAYYLRARPYSPALARFLSNDPIRYEGSQWNLYEYVHGDPARHTDPFGEWVRFGIRPIRPGVGRPPTSGGRGGRGGQSGGRGRRGGQGKGERGKHRKNPNPEKEKTKDPHTGKQKRCWWWDWDWPWNDDTIDIDDPRHPIYTPPDYWA